MEQRITDAEIKHAVFSLNGDKSLVPNWYAAHFFK